MKVTQAIGQAGQRPVFICDFSPPRGGDRELLADAKKLEADFFCVAYNPGKAVRIDTVAAAFEINRTTGRGTVFNLSPRDMNKLAIESRLLGAQTLGLENVLVVQGDPVTERDKFSAVADYTSTQLMAAIRSLNNGVDFKAGKLRGPTDFCIGASMDLSRPLQDEVALAIRKVESGADFFITQPVFDAGQIDAFRAEYERQAGEALDRPVAWGLQILVSDGVLFSSVPEEMRAQLEAGRDGVEIAQDTYAEFQRTGVDAIYLVSPIMRGGARDYDAAVRFLAQV